MREGKNTVLKLLRIFFFRFDINQFSIRFQTTVYMQRAEPNVNRHRFTTLHCSCTLLFGCYNILLLLTLYYLIRPSRHVLKVCELFFFCLLSNNAPACRRSAAVDGIILMTPVTEFDQSRLQIIEMLSASDIQIELLLTVIV